MKVTEEEVLHVAELANLELTAEERSRMLRDLNHILDHIDRLNTLTLDGVAPMAQVAARSEPRKVMRDDAPGTSLGAEAAMANAPEPGGALFKVPKVIER